MSLESRLQDLDYNLGRTFYKLKKSANPLLLYETIPNYAKLIVGTTKDLICDSYRNRRESAIEQKKTQKNMTVQEKAKKNLINTGKTTIKATKKLAKKTLDTILSPQTLGIIGGLTAVNHKFYENASFNLPFNATLSGLEDYLSFIPKVIGNTGYALGKNTWEFLKDTVYSVFNFDSERFLEGLDKISYLIGLDKELIKDISFATTKQIGESIDEISPFIITGSILAVAGYYSIKRKHKKNNLIDNLIVENKNKPKSKKLTPSKLDARIDREIKKRIPSLTTDFLKGLNKTAITYGLTIALLGKSAELYNHFTGYIKNSNSFVNLGIAISDTYYGFMTNSLIGVKYVADYFVNKGLPNTLGFIGGDAIGQTSYVLNEIGKYGGKQLFTGGITIGIISLGFWGASKYNHFKDKASDAEINRINKKYK
jgi:hypothetical protein